MKTNFYLTIPLLLIISILIQNINCKIDPKKVVVAINCGGNDYRDSNGVLYEEDKYFNKGTPSDHGLSYDIKNTIDKALYQTERWSSDTLTYTLPLKSGINGKYVLVLKFSEVYFNNAGEKVFNVGLGKEKVIKNLDVFDRVGKAFALDEYIEFEIRENRVYYKKRECKGALESGNKLVVNFIKGKADNPKINAILLIKGTLNDSDYYETQKKNSENRKKKLSESKKLKVIDLRHDSDELYDEEKLMNDDLDIDSIKKDGGLFSIFSSPLGTWIGGSLLLFGLLNYLIDFC